MNIYPYNYQPKIQKQAETTVQKEKESSTPRDNTEFKDNRSFAGSNPQVEYSHQKTVNISNIVEDFKKTLAAIDASEEINEEVNTYLKLVDTQAQKEKPSSKIIRANLANASGILDEYITQTLNKPSKVVTDWINALLLQKIDYKADKPVEKTEPPAVQPEENVFSAPGLPGTAENLAVKENPTGKKLEKLYKKTEILVDSGKFRQALLNYEKLLPEAQKTGHKDIETKIYLDKAYIYDSNRDYPPALENYHKAAAVACEAGNSKIQAISHYNIASIYDEFGQVSLALEHYYAALSHDGQVDNLKAQANTLNDVGNIFSSVRKYKTALDHYQTGVSLTRETNDLQGRAFLFSNIGSVFKETGKDGHALKFYRKSIECDIKTGNLEGYSINYEQAGDIMNRNNKPQKAYNLYKKSLAAAQKLDERDLSSRLIEKLGQNNLSY